MCYIVFVNENKLNRENLNIINYNTKVNIITNKGNNNIN